MICDAILYNGERDIFDLRYNILKDVVDEFVVCEFSQTFSGKPKEAHPIDLPKVSYHYITEWEEMKPDMPEAFQREYSQREAIKTKLTHLGDWDTVVVGDCDEIWSPEALKIDGFKKLRLKVYSYFINNRSSEDFTLGPFMSIYGFIEPMSLNELRSAYPLTKNYYGWHFTNMGGLDKLKHKIESYGHEEFNTPQIKNNLEQQIKDNKDYIGRDFEFKVDESEWPLWLKEHRQDYKHLLK